MKTLTVTEVTKIFGVSRQSIYNWRKKGLIKEIKLGTSVRFNEEEIKKIMKNGVK